MTDYTSLVNALRTKQSRDNRTLLDTAADAIERLQRERDAAVADISPSITGNQPFTDHCKICKHRFGEDPCQCLECDEFIRMEILNGGVRMRLIDADYTIDLLQSLGSRDYRREKGTIQDAIKMLSYEHYTPTVDAVPVVHGHWIQSWTGDEEIVFCSVCKDESNEQLDVGIVHNYCPNCGAKMDGKVEDG